MKDNLATRKSCTQADDTTNTQGEYHAIQSVVSRYVGQLLDGCDDSSCNETLCATGKRNVSKRPVRGYTRCSARILAITLASGPTPRSRLCPRYNPNHGGNVRTKVDIDEARDPSAFMQHVGYTKSVLSLCNKQSTSEGNAALPIEFARTEHSFDHLRKLHRVLDDLLGPLSVARNTSVEEILKQIAGIADRLYECMECLQSPSYDEQDKRFRAADESVKNGHSTWDSQQHTASSTLDSQEAIEAMDRLEYAPLQCLLDRVLNIVARKTHLLTEVLSEDHIGWTRDTTSRYVYGSLAQRIIQSSPIYIIVWLKSAFLRHWNGETILAESSTACTALIILESLYQHDDLKFEIYESQFSIPAISARLDAEEVGGSYIERDYHRGKIHLLSFGFLFSTSERTVYFRMRNHLRMRKAHSDAQKTVALHARVHSQNMELEPEHRFKYLEEHYLLLSVKRTNILQDAFDQLWQRRRGELLRPLRVRLGEVGEFEVGHDLGGVQIEFFNLLCKELFKEENQMFTTDETTGLSYFRQGSLQPLYMFELCGLLFGIAIYNGITLPVNFPWVMYYCVLTPKDEQRPDIALISDGWPALATSLESLLQDDITGIENDLPFEANGLRLTVLPHLEELDEEGRLMLPVVSVSQIVHHEDTDRSGVTPERDSPVLSPTPAAIEEISLAWPGWHLYQTTRQPEEIIATSKHSFAQGYVEWLVYGSVEPQCDAFRKGFFSVIDESSMGMLGPRHLRAVVQGSSRLDINDLRRSTTYVNYDPNSKYIKGFWRVVLAWPKEKQKQLLKFVTAIERMPAGGAGNFAFRIERPPNDTDSLPTSSTCFRTLFLPKYPSIEILDKKLSLAFEYGLESFGTG